MSAVFIPIVLGTARHERQSEKVASFLFGELKRFSDVESEIIDVKDFLSRETIPAWVPNSNVAYWRESAGRADGFIFVVPEYNHGYPGEFKILLDNLINANFRIDITLYKEALKEAEEIAHKRKLK